MTELQVKTNASFGGSENGSPGKKNNSSLFGSFFKKKPDTSQQQAPVDLSPQLQNPVQEDPQQNQVKQKNKQREMYKRNIADGRVKLSIAESDKVYAGSEYRDNPYDLLDQAPMRTTSYIENLRSRDFSQINNREVKRFIETQKQQKEIRPNLNVENLEIELIELSKSYDTFLAKFFRFFQGLLPGFCLIHLFLVFNGGSDEVVLSSYVLSGLRISQIFYLIALISTLGVMNRYIETRSLYKDSMRSQPIHKEALGKQANKYLVASICYFIVYAIIVYNREFVGKTSNAPILVASNFTNNFSVFKALSAVMAAFSVIGWISLILAFKELNQNQVENPSYSELTGDESFEEMA